MIETVWIAFACGLVIGSCLGILTLALIIAGKNEVEIKETWEGPLSQFKRKRKKYLLYPDFKE